MDNIDDILSNLAEDIATNHIYFVCEFIETTHNVLNSFLLEKLSGFSFDSDITFLFLYRTANYLNVVKSSYLNISNRGRFPEYFINAPKYRISTVKSSKEIFDKRLNLYFSLCKYNEREPDINALLIQKLINSLDKTENINTERDEDLYIFFTKNETNDLNNIFRLWNGNRICVNNMSCFIFII